jgi:hypothetical protein
MWCFQKAFLKAFMNGTGFITQNTRQQSHHRINHHSGGNGSIG